MALVKGKFSNPRKINEHIQDPELEETPELFQKSELTDMILVVEGKKLHFAKYPLMAGSSVFTRMIQGFVKASPQASPQLVLDDISYRDMIMFLECLHPKTLKLITDTNLEQIAAIAHRFKHEGILYRCQEYIIEKLNQTSTSKDEMYSEFFFHMKVADKFEMERAIQVGVSSGRVEKAYFSTNSIEYSGMFWDKGYENNENFQQLSADTKVKILSRRLKSTEKGIRSIPEKVLSSLSSRVPSLWR